MADGRSRLSAVLSIGGKVLPSVKGATDEIDKRLGRVTKTVGKLEAAEKSLRREMRSAPKGEQYDAMARRAEVLRRRIESVRSEQERLERRSRGMERLSSLLGSAREGAARFASAGLTAIGVGAVAAAAGIAHLASETAEHGVEMEQYGRRIGFSRTQLEGLGLAAQSVGANIEDGVDAAKTLQERIGDALNDRQGEYAKSFRRLGIDLMSIASMAPEEQLEAFADALSQIPDQSRQMIAATDFMGDAGARLLPVLQQGGEAFRRFGREASEMGLDRGEQQTRDYLAAMLELKNEVTAVGRTIGLEVMPVLTEVFHGFATDLQGNRDGVRSFARDIGGAFRQVGGVIREHGPKIIEVGVRLTRFLVDAIPPAVELTDHILDLVDELGGAETVVKALGVAWGISAGVTVVGKVRGLVAVVSDLSGLLGGSSRSATALGEGLGSLPAKLGGVGEGVAAIGRFLVPVALAAATIQGTLDQFDRSTMDIDDPNHPDAQWISGERRFWARLGNPFGIGLTPEERDAREADTEESRRTQSAQMARRSARLERSGLPELGPGFGLEAAGEGPVDRTSLPEAFTSGRGGGANQTVNNNQSVVVNQTINAAPGQSPEEIGDAAASAQRRDIEAMINGSYAGG